MQPLIVEVYLEYSHSINGEQRSQDIAAISPFTTWKVVVFSLNNAGLCLDGVQRAFLEFRGTSQSLTQNYRAGGGVREALVEKTPRLDTR